VKKLYLVPMGDAKIKCPKSGKVLAAEGAMVELSTFWRRRLNDGSVKEGKAPLAQKKIAEAPKVEAKKVENYGGKK
jgi:hypothetical protein